MPLTPRGKKIMKSMKEQYGKKKGEQVFYATKNKGKLKGVEKAYLGKAIKQPTETKKEFEMRHAYHKPFMKKPKGFRGGDAAKSDAASGRSAGRSAPSGGDGRDPSAQYKNTKPLSQQAKQALTQQRETARGRISPSTTTAGKVAKYGAALAFGIPTFVTAKAIDYSPLAFGVPKGTKKAKDTEPKNRDGEGQKIIQPVITPVQTTKPIDTSLISPKDNFFNFVAYKTGGLSGGVRYGTPPKKGPNSQVPPVKMKKGGYKK
jgi:hypothetical protein